MEVVKLSENKCNVIYRPHPIFTGRDCQYLFANEGDTVRELLVKAGVDAKQPIVISLDDRLLKVSEWDVVCPKVGQIINVKATVMGGGGGGGSNPMQTVAMVALVITAAVLAAPTGGASLYLAGAMGISATTAGALIGAGMMIAGSMLINAVFAANPASSSMGAMSGQYAEASPTYSLSGGSNRIRPYESMPVIFGQIQFFPDLAARPYTEYQGADQYLYQIFHFGLSDAEYTDFRIGTTSLSDYTDVTWKLPDAGGKIAGFPGNVDSIQGVDLTNAVGWTTRTSSQNTYRLGIDIEGVLYYANNSGGLESTSVSIRAQVKKSSESSWNDAPLQCSASGVSITSGGITLTGNSQKPVRGTIFIDVDNGEYDVRLIRDTADSTDARLQNKTSWSALRSYQEDVENYDGQHRRGLIIKATSQLNGSIQQLSCKATAKATYWNGSSWVTTATRNPAHWFMDFAVGKRKAYGKLIYGAGRSRESLDLDCLHSWAQFCHAEGLTFDAVLDGSQTVQDFLNTIARCGFGSMTLANGKLGVVWDQRNSPVSAAYGMSNIIAGSFEVTYLTENIAEEIIVRYSNPDKDYIQDEVRVVVDGVENPTRTSSVDLYGCANKAMAGKFANYLAAQQKYRTRRIKWDCDFEGFVSQRGDCVLLSHDLTQWGYSGRIYSISNNNVNNANLIDGYVESGYVNSGYVDGGFDPQYGRTIKLDRPVPRSGAIEYLTIKRPDGSMDTYEVEPGIGESDVLTLTTNPELQPNALYMDHLWFFSPLPTPGKKVKILSVQPSSESRVQIIATDEYDELYQAWDGGFEAPPTNTLLAQSPVTITNLKLSVRGASINGVQVNRASARWGFGGGAQYALVRFYLDSSLIKEIPQSYTAVQEIDISSSGSLMVEVIPVWSTEYGPMQTAIIDLPSLDLPSPPASVSITSSISGKSSTFEWVSAYGANSYVIEVWSSGALKRAINVGNTLSWSYTIDDAISDGGPFRSYQVRVYSVSTSGQSATYASANFNNSQIGSLLNASITALPSSLWFNYEKPSDPDFAGVMVWLSSDPEFTPSNSTLIYDGAESWITIKSTHNGAPLETGKTYYLYAAGYDTFGKDSLTYTGKFTQSVLSPAWGLIEGDITESMLSAGLNDKITNAGGQSEAIQTITSQVDELKTSVEETTAAVDGVAGKYTVKVDNNGYVSGFGLISTQNNATPTSEFAIVADRFSLAPVATNPGASDGSPFFVITAPTIINGVSVPAGAYIKSAFIQDASITNAKIENASITSAKIADASITNAKISGEIKSSDFVAGVSGWNIDKNGYAELNNAVFRGVVEVASSASGARMIIKNNVIKVFDENSVLRVQIGDLSV